MSMSIVNSPAPSASGSSFNPAKAAARHAFRQVRSDLKSGDISGAQQAFGTLTQNVPAAVLNSPNTALGQLNTALQSGDVGAAKVAWGAFAENVHTYRHTTSPTPASVGTVLDTVA